MFTPRWFMPYDVLIMLVMTAVSMAIAIFALRGFRWVKERSLYYLFMAFVLLAIGFFANGLTLGYDFLQRTGDPNSFQPMAFIDLGYAIYFLCSIVAYGILAYAYFRNVREASLAAAIFGMLLTSSIPLIECIIIVLLFALVFAQIIHLSIHRSRYSMIVCGSFMLILASHIMMLMSDMAHQDYYVFGKLLQLGAFVMLLAMLLKLRGPE